MMRVCRNLCCGALILLLLLNAAACDGLFGNQSFPQPGVQTGQVSHQETQTAPPENNEQSTAVPAPPSTEKDTEKETEKPTEPPATAPSVADRNIVVPGELGYTYPEMVEDLAALQEAYGSFFSYQSIGKSVDGREIYACVVGNPNAKHKMLISGGIHGKVH